MFLVALRGFGRNRVHHAGGDLKADPRERLIVKELKEAVELLPGLARELSVLGNSGANGDVGVLGLVQQGLNRPKEVLDVACACAVNLFDAG